jgi:hypothetical protein
MANPKPTITFRVNLYNMDPLLKSDLPPYQTQLTGNETVTEATSQIDTRTSYFASSCGLNKQGNLGPGGSFAGYQNGDTFEAYGQNAYYIKRTYCKGNPDDLLTVVSTEW